MWLACGVAVRVPAQRPHHQSSVRKFASDQRMKLRIEALSLFMALACGLGVHAFYQFERLPGHGFPLELPGIQHAGGQRH